MNKLLYKSLLASAAIMILAAKVNGQTTLPDELTKNPIREQINYIDEHTRIYENYRAIREDMYQKVNSNVNDTLAANRKSITGLNNTITTLRYRNDSLTTVLETTNKSLEEVTTSKNSIKVLGIQVNKVTYNTIMFIIVAGLVLVLLIGFLAFKRILVVNISSRKEIKDLRDEFENYRQSTRIAREKMAMDHFNEIKKLKGGK